MTQSIIFETLVVQLSKVVLDSCLAGLKRWLIWGFLSNKAWQVDSDFQIFRCSEKNKNSSSYWLLQLLPTTSFCFPWTVSSSVLKKPLTNISSEQQYCLSSNVHTLSLSSACACSHTHTHSLYITCACMHPHTPFSYSFIDLAKCFFKFLKLSSDDEKNFFECAIFLLPSFFIALEISNFLNGSSSRGVSHGCRHRDPFFLMASH